MVAMCCLMWFNESTVYDVCVFMCGNYYVLTCFRNVVEPHTVLSICLYVVVDLIVCICLVDAYLFDTNMLCVMLSCLMISMCLLGVDSWWACLIKVSFSWFQCMCNVWNWVVLMCIMCARVFLMYCCCVSMFIVLLVIVVWCVGELCTVVL